jgi:hypothetical protein
VVHGIEELDDGSSSLQLSCRASINRRIITIRIHGALVQTSNQRVL